MRLPEDIIIQPYVTEKSNEDLAYGKYTFIVAKNATKTEIGKAVEKLFNVKVIKVNTANFTGKMKRMGVHQGRRASWKKAVVKIDLDPKGAIYLGEGGKETVLSKKYNTEIEEFGAMQ